MVLVDQAPGRSPEKSAGRHGRDHSAVIFVLTDDELEETINSTLANAGCTLEQLREEARTGEFSSESNWRTWFCIAPFVEQAI